MCEVGEDGAWDPERCAAWPDGGTTGDPTGGPTTGDPTGDGPTSGGPTDGDTDSDSGGQDGLVEHGCACDSAGEGPPVALGLLALGLLRRRRRR